MTELPEPQTWGSFTDILSWVIDGHTGEYSGYVRGFTWWM